VHAASTFFRAMKPRPNIHPPPSNQLINSLRFTLKSLGYTIANPSTERFHKVIQSALPGSVVQMIAPSVQAIEELSLRIKLLEREIRTLAHTKYPDPQLRISKRGDAYL